VINNVLLRMIVGFQTRVTEREDRGATAVEYGLIVGLVSLAIVTAITAFGTSLSDMFDRLSTEVGKVAP
jgi:pilus assembly protein Flp/PilA